MDIAYLVGIVYHVSLQFMVISKKTFAYLSIDFLITHCPIRKE